MQHIPDIDHKGLREFGIVTGAIIAILFGLFFPWLFDRAWPVWPWITAALLAAWGIIAPRSMRALYRLWMGFGLFMSKIMTPLVLGILYYVLFTPMAVVMRLAGRDALSRKFQPNAESYRVDSNKADKKSIERPF